MPFERLQIARPFFDLRVAPLEVDARRIDVALDRLVEASVAAGRRGRDDRTQAWLVHQHEVARVDLAGHRTFGAAFQRQVDLAAFHVLVDVEEPEDRAGVGRTHAHGAAAGFGAVAQFYRSARIRDGLDLQPIDPAAGAAIVELHVREFFVVKTGDRLHVDAHGNGAALRGLGGGARIVRELPDHRAGVERLSLDVDRIALAGPLDRYRNIVVAVQPHPGKFRLRQAAVRKRDRADHAEGRSAEIEIRERRLAVHILEHEADIARDAGTLGPAGPRNVELGIGEIGLHHLPAATLGIDAQP